MRMRMRMQAECAQHAPSAFHREFSVARQRQVHGRPRRSNAHRFGSLHRRRFLGRLAVRPSLCPLAAGAAPLRIGLRPPGRRFRRRPRARGQRRIGRDAGAMVALFRRSEGGRVSWEGQRVLRQLGRECCIRTGGPARPCAYAEVDEWRCKKRVRVRAMGQARVRCEVRTRERTRSARARPNAVFGFGLHAVEARRITAHRWLRGGPQGRCALHDLLHFIRKTAARCRWSLHRHRADVHATLRWLRCGAISDGAGACSKRHT